MGIRVFHCDDSEAFTRLVAFWLAEHDDIEHVGEAHTAEAALAALPTADADVVLLDTLGRPGDDTLLQRGPRGRARREGDRLLGLRAPDAGGRARRGRPTPTSRRATTKGPLLDAIRAVVKPRIS